MRRAAVARARLWVGALACAGVASSHWIAYRLVAPDAPRREELLEATGHRYFALVVGAALIALVVGLGEFVAESISSRGRPVRARKLFSFALGRLTALQATGFVVLEALERLSVGEHHFASALLTERTTLLGIALQVLLALIAALLLVALRRVIVQARAVRRPLSHFTASSWNSRVAPPRLLAVAGDAAPRAPPTTL
ncbi:MAG: hypothetical protein M3454_17430 [Actinomycetota bacterium]|nr:hypothetical protein [Actinomycetota bacterium]